MVQKEPLESLMQWAKLQGLTVADYVDINRGPHGFQATAKEDVESRTEPLMRLPLDLALTPQKAADLLPFGSVFAQTSNRNIVLKIYLAYAQAGLDSDKNSPFIPYIQALPLLDQTGSPYVWNAEQKAFLKGTNLGNSLKENTAALVEEWWTVVNKIPEDQPKPTRHFENLKFYYEFKFYEDQQLYEYLIGSEKENWTSFPRYLWASMMLKSRAFPCYLAKDFLLPYEVAKDEAMLLPVIDLLNHNPSAHVQWSCSKDGFFELTSEDPVTAGGEIFNNYGLKGNEELLLAYGFCLKDNAADSAALKIKVPLEILPQLEDSGVQLPKITDYTTSVVDYDQKDDENESDNAKNTKNYEEYKDGLLFFITEANLPENLVKLFQCLVRNQYESNKITLRMQLAGINQLRHAIEAKKGALPQFLASQNDSVTENIAIYLDSQRKIYTSTVKRIKKMEKAMLVDPEIKPRLLTLKSVFNKDLQLQRALLVAYGFRSYDDVVNSGFQDHLWLLFLIRCYNKDEYSSEDGFFPSWINQKFTELEKSVEITSEMVIQYKDIYLSLIPQLVEAVPEVFGRGKWRVEELIISARVLDSISFVRGTEQECILVEEREE